LWFHAKREILAAFYSEQYGDFVELIKFFGVIGTLTIFVAKTKTVYYIEKNSYQK